MQIPAMWFWRGQLSPRRWPTTPAQGPKAADTGPASGQRPAGQQLGPRSAAKAPKVALLPLPALAACNHLSFPLQCCTGVEVLNRCQHMGSHTHVHARLQGLWRWISRNSDCWIELFLVLYLRNDCLQILPSLQTCNKMGNYPRLACV